MDRQIVYNGAIPLETDLLNTNKNTMIALGKLAAALVGTSTQVTGLSCTPTSPATMQVNVGPGEIYSLQNIDGTAYSSLAADTTHQIVKQGISLDTVALSCPAPTTPGQSINYLIEAAYQDSDTSSVVLPYYNSSNPSVAYSGPANSGTAQPTARRGIVSLVAKAGVAATTGSQVTPSPDAGYSGLYVVTVAYGATSIVAGNIALASGAPFMQAPGTVAATTSVAGVAALATQAEANAGTVPNKILTPATAAQADIAGGRIFAVGGGTANALTASVTPTPAALVAGVRCDVVAAATNTGPATFNLNGLGAIAINANGGALSAGMIAAGRIIKLTYDGTVWQMTNAATVANATTASAGIVQIATQAVVNAGTDAAQTVSPATLASAEQRNTFRYATAGGTANALTATMTPAPASLAAGLEVLIKASATNTGAATLNLNGLGAVAIQYGSTGLVSGALVNGQIYRLVYDGTVWQLITSQMVWALASDTIPSIKTWQSPARSLNTTYQNTTGYPIQVCVNIDSPNNTDIMQVSADGVTWITLFNFRYMSSVAFTVLNGHYYRTQTTGATLLYWNELR